MKPAWSWQFDDDRLEPVAPLDLPAEITREWAWGDATGQGVRVGVVDSGIDAEAAGLGPLAGDVAIEVDGNGIAKVIEGHHEDLFGHGTACASIIRVAAPECQLYSIRVLGTRLSGKGTAFIAGLRWAIDAGLQVVNLSLGTDKREYFAVLHELVDEAYFHNMMLISAVNNLPTACYPSQYSSVISVAAHQGRDPFHFDYNPSPPVEFGAPGIDLDLRWRNGATNRVTGNSFAAPHVTGLVARILSRHRGLTPFQMKTILHALADNTGGR